MAEEKKDIQNLDKAVAKQEEKAFSKVRITLCETHSVKNINSMSRKIIDKSRELKINIKGPIRMPVKKLSITTRKTPCGEGSKTWDHFQMKIHKWFFDLCCSPEDIRQLIDFETSSNVTVDISTFGSEKLPKKFLANKGIGVEAKKLIEATA